MRISTPPGALVAGRSARRAVAAAALLALCFAGAAFTRTSAVGVPSRTQPLERRTTAVVPVPMPVHLVLVEHLGQHW